MDQIVACISKKRRHFIVEIESVARVGQSAVNEEAPLIEDRQRVRVRLTTNLP